MVKFRERRIAEHVNSKHSTHTPNHLCLHSPICPCTAVNSLTHPHLYQHVGCIVETHDQSSHSCHVVHVGKRDEGDRCHMVQEHDQEILGTQLPRKRYRAKESKRHIPRARHDKVKRDMTVLCAHTIALCLQKCMTICKKLCGTIVQCSSAFFQNWL